MKSLFVLERLRVSNANAISGLTWGFPSITHFLGFTHALSRTTQKQWGFKLTGCGIICHDYQHKTQTNAYGRHSFSLTRNPLTRKGETAPFNEEGKMHMEVSLVIETDLNMQDLDLGPAVFDKQTHLINQLIHKINTLRLAGGSIEDLGELSFYPMNSDDDLRAFKKQLRRLLPGFALVDRSSLLQEHLQKMQGQDLDSNALDAWLDFSAIKFAPQIEERLDEQPSEQKESKANWQYQSKPGSGYLVPLMVGYKGISPLYDNTDVKSTRDDKTPVRFVESAYGVGQWLSPHRIRKPEQLIWHYHQQNDWYLCQNHYKPEESAQQQIETHQE